MKSKKLSIISVAAAGLILLLVAVAAFQLGRVASAQEGVVVEQMAMVAKTATLLQYQGRLSDPGTGEAVADGRYTMTLRLYDVPTGGQAVWTEVQDVLVQDGLFSTVLGGINTLDRSLFDGRALWLGVKVGADAEAAPRQQVLPVAYALGLVPGAAVQANSVSPAFSVSNSGSGAALQAMGTVLVDGDLTVDGQLNGGTHNHTAHNNDPNAHHVRYTDAEAASAALNHPEIVTQYEFQDHLNGGMHSGRALAFGVINGDGTVATATGNVSSRWNNKWQCFEITIDGHDYDHFSYVTVVTPIAGGIANAWSLDNNLCVGIYLDRTSPAQKLPFQFVTFQP